jgi:alpha-glucosidase
MQHCLSLSPLFHLPIMTSRILIIVFALGLAGQFLPSATMAQGKKYTLTSPDLKTEVTLVLQEKISMKVQYMGMDVLGPVDLSMSILESPGVFLNPVAVEEHRASIAATIIPVAPEKRSLVSDVYNLLEISFKGGWGLKVRAYDDGVAYRFFTRFSGDITVVGEEMAIGTGLTDSIYFPEEKSFLTHSERLYKYLAVTAIADTQMCSLPALLVKPGGLRIAVTESDLLDYPGLYLKGSGGKAMLNGLFPPYPLEEKLVGDRTLKVTRSASFIAKTKGTREYPWRVFAIASEDKSLIENDIVFRLASPSQISETGWIRPGKVAWDWWNANNIRGVGFKSGVNTATYKYYIDFASKYGIEYIILDEGWSKPADLFSINPDMNMDELFAYAGEKQVGIILWVLFNALDDRMEEALDRFRQWGAKGIKVDFMQRDDQKIVNYYEKVASAAARRQLLVDFHGSYKPTGLNRTWPNVLTREGVKGLENCKWSDQITPKHDVTLPFIRMFAGAMDYTPGAMRNATKENFRIVWDQPMSQGTRCHQLAMYVVYESPLQMLCDNPSNYLAEPEAMEFLAKVPVTWDETKAVHGRVGEYVTVARRHGATWYIGSMTGWNQREAEVLLDFLTDGAWEMKIWSDGINADRDAADFRITHREVTKEDKISIHLAPGGGWVARLIKK